VPEPIIHPTALPNTLSCSELRVRPGQDGSALAITPGRAGWRYLSFRVVRLAEGEGIEVGSDAQEAVIVTIGGGGVGVELGAAQPGIDLPGRSSPFDALPWAAYMPAGTSARVVGRPDGSETDRRAVVAVAEAPRSGSPDVATTPFVVSPDDVEIEVRGAGNATRQINKIIAPGSPADRLEVVEVLTPSGNWSSWPPHKHDRDAMPDEAVLEEVYYYRFRRPPAWGLQRVYRPDRSRDCLLEVHDGDCVMVSDGYHPFVAAHGDDAYYLNALAGDRRTMACSFDPDLDWVRGSWAEMAPDPRIPLVGR
jgi:5-deoxy-glucuronate isomerase